MMLQDDDGDDASGIVAAGDDDDEEEGFVVDDGYLSDDEGIRADDMAIDEQPGPAVAGAAGEQYHQQLDAQVDYWLVCVACE